MFIIYILCVDVTSRFQAMYEKLIIYNPSWYVAVKNEDINSNPRDHREGGVGGIYSKSFKKFQSQIDWHGHLSMIYPPPHTL